MGHDRKRRWIVTRLTLVLSLLVVVGCEDQAEHTSSPLGRADTITVGSFDFAESSLLGELYSQALEAESYTVVRAKNLGPRELVGPALAVGLVDLVPDYAGTALAFMSLGAATVPGEAAATHAALVDVLADRGLVALGAAPAENANAFVVTLATAQREGLRQLSDLVGVAPTLVFGGPPECPSRPLCLVGLKERYGIGFREVVALDAGGPVTHQALDAGVIDVGLLFTTDPALTDGDLVALTDDRGLQPAENITPLVRREVVEQWGPGLVATIDAVSRQLTTEDLRAMNAQVTAAAGATDAVAAAWLQRKGLR